MDTNRIDQTAKPLVLLDVDGVINDLGALYGHPRSWDIDVVASHGYRVHIPDYMPGLVQDLVANAEVWWCTTWRRRANDGIRVHLGIGDLPVVDDRSNSRHVAWKPAAAGPIATAAIAEGRPVYWIEDFYGRLPHREMPEGVVYVDTAAATDRAVLTPSTVPAALRSDGPLQTEA